MKEIIPMLIETAWLAERLGQANIRVLDGTWHQPSLRLDAFADFLAGHLPGAVYFDIDAIADHSTPLPHMLPEPEHFAVAMTSLGIAPDTHVIIYDQHGIRTAPRVWWTFRAFGHDKVSVLNGGLPKWKIEGRPVESGPAKMPQRTKYPVPQLNRDWLVGKQDILDNLNHPRFQIVDARSAERFAGTAPEPWPGRKSGHIPGSLNTPFERLIDPATKTFFPADHLRHVFTDAGVDFNTPIVTSCGSGITASILAFALSYIGAKDVAVYDGSWAEWGLPGSNTPIDVG